MTGLKFEDTDSAAKEVNSISQKLDDLSNERNILNRINDFIAKDAAAQSRWIESAEQHLQGNPRALQRLRDISESDRKEVDKCQIAYEEALKSNSNAIRAAEDEYDARKQKLAKAISESKGRNMREASLRAAERWLNHDGSRIIDHHETRQIRECIYGDRA